MKNQRRIKAYKNHVLAELVDKGMRLSKGGILIIDDDMQQQGIRPRWFRIYSAGSRTYDLKDGEYVLVQHGRWSRGFRINLEGEDKWLYKLDYPDAIMLASDELPSEYVKLDVKL